MVLKRCKGRTNISLMFLFPWLDWGIDTSDFEKIDFLGHERFLAFSAPWSRAFLTLERIFRGPLGGPRVKIFQNFFRNFSKNFYSFEKYILGILRPRSRSEIDFLEKNLQKSRKDINPPWLVSVVIYTKFSDHITAILRTHVREMWLETLTEKEYNIRKTWFLFNFRTWLRENNSSFTSKYRKSFHVDDWLCVQVDWIAWSFG